MVRHIEMLVVTILVSIIGTASFYATTHAQLQLKENEKSKLYLPFAIISYGPNYPTQAMFLPYRSVEVNNTQNNLPLIIYNPNGGTGLGTHMGRFNLTFSNTYLNRGQGLHVAFDSYYSFNREMQQVIPYISSIVMNFTKILNLNEVTHLTHITLGNSVNIPYTSNSVGQNTTFVIPNLEDGPYLVQLSVYFPVYKATAMYSTTACINTCYPSAANATSSNAPSSNAPSANATSSNAPSSNAPSSNAPSANATSSNATSANATSSNATSSNVARTILIRSG
jgi:hypothetical protein